MKYLSILWNAAWFVLTWTAAAHAGPLAAAAAAIGGIWAALGPIGELVVTVGLQIGANLLAKALAPSPASAPVSGISTQATYGDATPVGFPVGSTATAGTFVYGGEWGNSGGTPNAYSTDVYCLSDLPIAAKPVIWVNGQKCTVDWLATPTAQGYPITDFRVSGVDYAWVLYRDGTQVAADSFLSAKFGADPNRPWKSTMIGLGCAYVVVTALYNRTLFPSFNKYLFEPGQTAWYDITQDSTAGGSGSHRWATPSTWAPTLNAKVVAYNLIRGVYYGSEWLFGGQNLAATRLPASSWIAAINACNSPISLAAGGTEPQFRCGLYVTSAMEPLTVIEEIDKISSAYTAEVGGMFKTLVGAPGSAVYSFTDGDVLVTKPQDLEPFPSYTATHNAVQGTYTEPAEQWQTKDAPDQENSAYVTADGGYYLPASVTYAAAPFALQIQRVMLTALNVGRRFLIHTLYLPPDAWSLEAGVDVVSWTSAWNFYSSKKFLVTRKEGNPGFQQKVTLLEVNPGADYSWSTANEQTPTVSFLGLVPTPSQPLTGWTASAADFVDSTGSARKPGIGVTWDSGQIDVRAVFVSAREKVSGNVEWSGEINYAAFPAGGTLPHAFLPNVTYQVQGDYIPYSGRAHTPSSWLDVTTNNVGNDASNILLAQLGQDTKDLLAWMGTGLREALASIQQLALQGASQDFANYTDFETITQQLYSQAGDLKAGYENAILVATGPSSAIAQEITTLFVAMGGDSAAVNVRYAAGYTPASGFTARAGLEARVNSGSAFHAAGIYFDTTATQAQTVIVGDQVVIGKDDGTTYALFNGTGELINGTIRGPGAGNYWNLLTGAFRVSNT